MKNKIIIFVVALNVLLMILFLNASPIDHLTQSSYAKGTFNIKSGETRSLAGNMKITMHNTGKLMLYKGDQIVWAERSAAGLCTTNCQAVFQADGNFVIYKTSSTGRSPLWASGTRGERIHFTTHTPFILISSSDNILWSGLNRYENFILKMGKSINFNNHDLRLTLQNDGNVVYYVRGKAVWASNTNNSHCKNCKVALQGDGNLVMYEDFGLPTQRVTWANNSFGTKMNMYYSGPKFGYALPPLAPIFTSNNYKRLTDRGCNRSQFGNHPSMGDIFISRQLNDQLPNGGCPAKSRNIWSLTAAKMDWSTNELKHLYKILDTTRDDLWVENGTMRITQANDITVTKIQGQLYVAFECHGVNFPAGSAACVGRLYKDQNGNYVIDHNSLSVVAKGAGGQPGFTYDDRFIYSAAVPKIVTHKNRTYLYWSQLLIDQSIPTSREVERFVSSSTVGIEVGLVDGRVRAKRSNGELINAPINANDPMVVEVMGLDQNRMKRANDSFQILSKGDELLMVGVASNSCVYPIKNTPLKDCYNLFFAHSDSPLQPKGFNNRVTFEGLPLDPSEYSGFLYRNTDKKTVFRYFVSEGVANKLYEWPDKVLYEYE